ncbi:MAG: YgiQ family radical SAM protein [Opitutales bacterium]|nr:YgiQ family radical SAM protein [Opitutales bacterium]
MPKMKTPRGTQFVPATREEMLARGWDGVDILLVSGDAYIDHPSFSSALIARALLDAGWRVGIIPQPDWKNPESLKIFGRPRLGCAVSAGNIDSMLRIYTAGRRMRREDMYSENGETGKCPPHATVVYSQLAKQAFPKIPVVVGGVEASLRRVAHYDYWQDKIRPPILADSKANILCYGMGELTMIEIFSRLEKNESLAGIRGTCRYLDGAESAAFAPDENTLELPSFEEVRDNPAAIMRLTKIVEANSNPYNAKRLFQRSNGRILLVEPPREPMSPAQFDKFCELPYAYAPHPMYSGKIPAWEMIRDSITVVRGCPGGCAFCGLVSHQGRHLVCRSKESVLRTARALAQKPFFKGIISDVGGAAGNIYGHRPREAELCKKCARLSCIFPSICKNYNADERPLMGLLDALSAMPEIRRVFVNSGVRLDLALIQPNLTKKIIRDHVSGQLSVAPEHLDPGVLRDMRKGKAGEFEAFKKIFDAVNAETGKRQFMVPYFISNFPGCTREQMRTVDKFLSKSKWNTRQVQDFIPLPMTMGCAMYVSQTRPDGTPIEVNKGLAERREQRDLLRRDRK